MRDASPPGIPGELTPNADYKFCASVIRIRADALVAKPIIAKVGIRPRIIGLVSIKAPLNMGIAVTGIGQRCDIQPPRIGVVPAALAITISTLTPF